MSTKPPTPITKEQEENKGDKPNTTPLDSELSKTELPVEQPAVLPVEQPAVLPDEQSAVLPAEQPAVLPVEQPAVLPVEQPAVLPLEQPVEQPVGPVEQPVGPVEQPVGPVGLPVEQPAGTDGNEQQFQYGTNEQQQGQQFQYGNEQQQGQQFQYGNEQQGQQGNEDKSETKNITVTIDKSTLVSLSQNLNINLLVTISAYKNVLSKLTEIVTNPDKQTKINENIEMLNGIEKSVTELLGSVQENLEIPADKLISASKILEEVNKGNNSFTNATLQIDAATILAFLGSAIAMVGGKKTKGRRKNVHKKTKRNKK